MHGHRNLKIEFYIHGSVHRESNTINIRQDTTVFSLLYFCRQLYMFRALTPIIRSSYNCNYSFWHWSTAMNKISSSVFYSMQLASARSCNYSCTSSWWWVSTPETCGAAYRNIIKWTQGALWDSNCHTVHQAHGAAPQDHSQPQPAHPGRTPHAVRHGLILLIMGKIMPETCWDRKFDNKHRISCILLVLSLHLIFTMHGHKILKPNTVASCRTITKLN